LNFKRRGQLRERLAEIRLKAMYEFAKKGFVSIHLILYFHG
jgi:hypothetical protein